MKVFTKKGKYLETITEKVQNAQRGCRTRLLDEEDIETFVDALIDMEKEARARGIQFTQIYLRIDGGGVAGSYRYSADTTIVKMDGGELTVERGKAHKNSRKPGVLTGGFRGKGNGGIRTLN